MQFENSMNRNGESSTLAGCSDEQLVEVLVAGNHDAMSVIFDRYYKMMMRVALRIVRDRGEAEDTVQVALTDFYRNAKSFEASKGRLSTWLLQYIYGRSINRRNGLESRRHFDHVDFADVDPLELVKREHSFSRLTSHEASLFVEQALQLLNEKQRRTVELISFGGLTIQEAAAATGDSAGNVQHCYYRSLKKLRSEFRRTRRKDRGPQSTENVNHSSWGVSTMDSSTEVLSGEVEKC